MSATKRAEAVEFGAALRMWRMARRWSQEGAAGRAGIPVTTWRNWEQGVRYPGRAQRVALETLMRVSDAALAR